MSERRIGSKRNGKVQANLVVRLAVVVEEVFANAEQLVAPYLNCQLFDQLSDDGVFCSFSRLHATAGKSPELFAFEPMQKHEFVLKRDGTGAEMKAVGLDPEGDHTA